MKITYIQNTELTIEHGGKTIVLDPSREYTGSAVQVSTSLEENTHSSITWPGEYDVSDISILGKQVENGIIYRMLIDGINIIHVGQSKNMKNSEFEDLYPCNVLILPTHFSVDTAKDMIDDFSPDSLLLIGDNIQDYMKKLGLSADETQSSVSIHKKDLQDESMGVYVLSPLNT